MIKVKLNEDRKKELQKLKRTRSHRSERALYILLSDEGLSVKNISEKLNRHQHTARTWIKAYIAHGIQGLKSKKPPGRARIKGVLVEEEIEKILPKTPREFGYQEEGWTVRIIMDYLLQKKIEIKPDTVRRALRRRGWVYKRFAKSVSKNTPTEEEKEQQVGQLIKKINLEQPDEIFFVDESNFTTGPYVQRGWFKKGEKKKHAAL